MYISKPTNGLRMESIAWQLLSHSSMLFNLNSSGTYWRKLSKHRTTPETYRSFDHCWQNIIYNIFLTSPSLLSWPPLWLCIQLAVNKDSQLRTPSSLEQLFNINQKTRTLFWRGTGQMKRNQPEKAVHYDVQLIIDKDCWVYSH